MAAHMTGLSIMGDRESGQDVRSSNVIAVMTLANILKTSLGPQGLDKMLVDSIGDVTITNDGATILQKLDVEHPAAKVLVELAQLQDREVGDGTTSVVILAAELLKRANELVKSHIHPTTIISGYRTAMKEAITYIKDNLQVKTESLPDDIFLNVAKTSLSSKFIGSENEVFSKLVVNAVKSVKCANPDGKARYPVAQINIVKSHGKSSHESTLVPNGYCMQLMRAGQGMPTVVKKAKIALLDFDLKKHQMKGVEVSISAPEELEKIRQKEMDITKDKIQKILNAGANVIFTSRGIDDMSIKYLVEAGCLGVRRVEKKDLKRLSKCTGAQIMLTLASLETDEVVCEAENLGYADEVTEERVGDNDFIFVKGCSASRASTILLRGANEFMLDEVERSVHDSLCAVSKTMESKAVVPGGGAVETAVSVFLENFSVKIDTREQLAIAEFAEALTSIPIQLTINAALDAIDLTSKLRAHHHLAQTESSKKELRFCGLDLVNDKVGNSLNKGIIEPAISKLKSLKFATEAAITILRIDDLIKLEPEPEAQGR